MSKKTKPNIWQMDDATDIEKINIEWPEHDRTSCNDQDLYNAGTVLLRHRCERCEALSQLRYKELREAQPPQAISQKSGDAHEIWAAAQLAPGEGIEDGVARVEALLGAQRVPMTDDEIRQCRLETEYDGTPSEPLIHRSTHSRFMAFARAVEQFHGIGVK